MSRGLSILSLDAIKFQLQRSNRGHRVSSCRSIVCVGLLSLNIIQLWGHWGFGMLALKVLLERLRVRHLRL